MTTDEAWKSLAQVNEWIRFADAKAVAVLAASGVLGGFLVRAIPTQSDFRSEPVRAFLLAVAIMCVGGSSGLALSALRPTLRNREPRSLVYFDHVALHYAKDRNGFVDSYVSLLRDANSLRRHLAGQVWSNSLIARRKLRRVSGATLFLWLAMVAGGSAVVAARLL